MNGYDYWPKCETCDRIFRTQRACDQHIGDKDLTFFLQETWPEIKDMKRRFT